MNIRTKLICFLLSSVMLFYACSSGRKMLEEGNYDNAVITSVERLQSNSTHKKASAVLVEAYPMAVKYHLDKIANYSATSDYSKYDRIVDEYTLLRSLYNKIQLSPVAQKLVNAESYVSELETAKKSAATFHYKEGDRNLAIGTKTAAKLAYNEYEHSLQLMSGLYTDYDVKMAKAMDMAITKVLVLPTEVHSNLFKISNEYFRNKVVQYLYEHPINKFVIFYTQSDAQKNNVIIDEVLDLSFDDFVVGQTLINKLERKVINDSVKTKTTIKLNGKDTVVNGYRRAEATLFVTKKTVESTGVLDVKIIDQRANTVVQQEKIPGTYIWLNQFGTYQGEKIALSSSDLKLVGNSEAAVPAPQTLFYEFTAPIFTKLMNKLLTRYKQY